MSCTTTQPGSARSARRRRLHRVAGLVLVCYWLALFISTHVPLPTGTLPGGSDKFAHFAAYAGLSFLLGLRSAALRNLSGRDYGLILAVTACYAAADELLQIPVGRNGDVWDATADLFGVVLGLTALWLLRPIVARLRPTVDADFGTQD